jgi:hypothetical protein
VFYVEVLCFAVPINSRLCQLVTGGWGGDIFIWLGKAVEELPYLLACNDVTKCSGLINSVLYYWLYHNVSKEDVRGADNNCQVPRTYQVQG